MWLTRNPGLLNVTLGRTAGKMKGLGVGGVGDGGGCRRDKIIRVFLKIERSRSQATDAAPPGRVQYVLHLSLVLTLRGVTAEALGL